MTSNNSEQDTSSCVLISDKPNRKERAVWTVASELRLLRSVCKFNPYSAGHGNALKTWNMIALDNLSVTGTVTGEACRAKTAKILKKFADQEAKMLKETGVTYNENATSDDMSEDIRLMLDIQHMIKNVESGKKEKLEKEKQLEEQQLALRENASKRLKEKQKLTTKKDKSKSKTSKNAILDIQVENSGKLNDMMEKNYSLEVRKFDLEEKRIKIEEERVRVEAENAKARSKEADNTAALLEILKSQKNV